MNVARAGSPHRRFHVHGATAAFAATFAGFARICRSSDIPVVLDADAVRDVASELMT